jgi:hypothetical protein
MHVERTDIVSTASLCKGVSTMPRNKSNAVTVPAKGTKTKKEDPAVAQAPATGAPATQAPTMRSNPLIQFAKRFERAGVGKAIRVSTLDRIRPPQRKTLGLIWELQQKGYKFQSFRSGRKVESIALAELPAQPLTRKRA